MLQISGVNKPGVEIASVKKTGRKLNSQTGLFTVSARCVSNFGDISQNTVAKCLRSGGTFIRRCCKLL